eukprot:scaffold2359_cov109-Skeletonema_marinoi.AAC.4
MKCERSGAVGHNGHYSHNPRVVTVVTVVSGGRFLVPGHNPRLKQMYHIDYLFVSQTTSAGAQMRLQRPFAVKRNCRPAASTAIATASHHPKEHRAGGGSLIKHTPHL